MAFDPGMITRWSVSLEKMCRTFSSAFASSSSRNSFSRTNEDAAHPVPVISAIPSA
ncbi:hypothetical protein D3C86_2039690 [compost metagenome]